MSTTLVETYSFRQPHQLRLKDSHRPERNLSVSFVSPTISCPISAEEKCATQLAHLASQHHGSEYNRMKFGPKGCPMTYVPLSIHMPDYVKELQARQTQHTEQKAWWPCQRQEITTKGPPDSFSSIGPPVILGPCGGPIPNAVNLQQELSAAISAPLEPIPEVSTSLSQSSHLKTSDSHPINISLIIPPEVLPILSSHLTPSQKPFPTIFDVPPAYSLDRATSCKPSTPSQTPRSSSLDRIPPREHPVSTTTNRAPPRSHWRTPSSVSEAIQAAINSGLAAAAQEIVKPVLSATVSSISVGSYAINPAAGSPTQPSCATRLFNRCEKTSTCTKQGQERAFSAPPIALDFPIVPSSEHIDSSLNKESGYASDPQDLPVSGSPTLSKLLYRSPFPRDCSLSNQERTASISQPYSQHVTPPPPPSYPSSFSLGNILLSSCPGKKVRLTGPVKGRSGVCRDLSTDLRRIRDLGVGCVICCLDDNELEFLGVPWTDYSRTAQEVGIDVLRIPIPEGLTPMSPSSLDSHLVHVIKTYTMRGVPILTHCRGGVGRAGLIACCWVLKLGLCGWIETDLRYRSRRGMNVRAGMVDVDTESGVRRDTMQLVERVIAVVRKRRSVKAVETYEQVKFLVDFVEYLRETPMTGAGEL